MTLQKNVFIVFMQLFSCSQDNLVPLVEAQHQKVPLIGKLRPLEQITQ